MTVATVALAVVTGVVAGSDGVVATLLGGVVVVAFFASSPVALTGLMKTSPGLSLLAALVFFGTKVVALAALLAVVVDADGRGHYVDQPTLGVSLITLTLVWTLARVRTATRQRIPAYDLDDHHR